VALLYVKGNKYKVQVKNQEVISDNKTVWTYIKDANEVQVNDYEPDENSITPSQIFTIYEKDPLCFHRRKKRERKSVSVH